MGRPPGLPDCPGWNIYAFVSRLLLRLVQLRPLRLSLSQRPLVSLTHLPDQLAEQPAALTQRYIFAGAATAGLRGNGRAHLSSFRGGSSVDSCGQTNPIGRDSTNFSELT